MRNEPCELTFVQEDIELFAVASGDHNPLHLDPEFAAGTAFGSCIVHGSLVAAGMLGALPGDALAGIGSLRLSLAGPVLPGAVSIVQATPSAREPGAWEVRLRGRGKTLARMLASPAGARDSRACPSGPVHPMRTTPAEPSASELRSGHEVLGEYRARPELYEVARRYGAGRLDPALLEGLAWASYVVGMELPGRHSLLAGLTLRADDTTDGEGALQSLILREFDQRTGQLVIDAALYGNSGAARSAATIECFALGPPDPPDVAALGIQGRGREAEHARELAGGAVVVIGGSRGFGAALSLALLARGYEVHVTYATSAHSASELRRLAQPHEARLHLTKLDASEPEAVRSLAGAFEHRETRLVGLALSAAPPPLAMGLTSESGTEVADYVAYSLRLATIPLGSLLDQVDNDSGWVLFCSSSAITKPPRDWPHYVSAKAAMEGLASWVAATRPSLRTVIVRPPKMRTAMTNTPSGRIGAAPTEIIAAWTADRISSPTLARGLTVLEPA